MKKRFLLALLACLCLLLAACSPSSVPEEEVSLPVDSEETVEETPSVEDSGETVFFYVADEAVTFVEFSFHYNEAVDSFLQSDAYLESGLDPDRSLASQQYPGLEMSWEDVFIQQVQDQLYFYLALSQEATEQGYERGERENNYIQEIFAQKRDYAEEMEMTLEELLVQLYGLEMTPEILEKHLERYVLGMGYEDHLRETTVYTDDELAAYYEEHEYAVKVPDGYTVTVRHIQMVNKQSALDVLEKFESGDKSEQSFIDLVVKYSEDTESLEDGGMYADILPQNNVDEYGAFELWAFDAARQPGEYTLLEDETGSDIVYFVEKNESFWKVWSRNTMLDEMLTDIRDQYDFIPVEE